jgi:hypothetical protein
MPGWGQKREKFLPPEATELVGCASACLIRTEAEHLL